MTFSLSLICTGWIAKGCVPQRYVVGFLCFLALTVAYIMRFCLSLAITEMVVPHHKMSTYHDPDACPYDTNQTTFNSTQQEGEFYWSEATQGLVLSSFFWGYVVTQLPGGLLAERYGGKQVLGTALTVSTICTLLTPIAARQGGPTWLIMLRVIMGLGQGMLYPSLHVLLAHWVPFEERGRLGCLVFAGANFGNVISNAVSGLVLGAVGPRGWPTLFYLYSGLGTLWLLAWLLMGFSTPDTHPTLSNAERKYLRDYSEAMKIKKNLLPTPWRAIFSSVPLWGLIIGQVGHDWGLFTIITDLPKYMKSVMHFTITQNGLLLALPYLLIWIVAILSGWFVDWLMQRKALSVTASRKLFTTLASVGPAVGIIGATYSGCNRIQATASFVLGMGFMGFFYPSLKVNALDLSPNYAGTISAFVMGIGAISGIVTPYLIGLLTPQSTLLQWRNVFWIAVGVLLFTNFVYILTASGEVQPWNNPDEEGNEQEKRKQEEGKHSDEPTGIR